jgi:proteasome lid subunit RPN8/RPN11
MSVYRETELAQAAARGRLVVAARVAQSTRAALQRFRGRDERHEGLVFWCGRTIDLDTFVMCAVIPESSHGAQRVHAGEAAMGRAARIARSFELGIVAQVHSHPGDDTRHSEGDDRLVFMPFENMFSLVVGDYGRGSIRPDQGAGLHQFQDGRWVWIENRGDAFALVPELVDSRE